MSKDRIKSERMLDIIVTHYDEPWAVGKAAFDILGMQRGINFDDFRVLLINDGEEHAIRAEDIPKYPYRVDVLTIPHGGISAARNAGIENSTAEWINFCDFDDTYSNIYALRDVMNVLPAPSYDLLWAHLLTEDFVDGNDILYDTPRSSIFVFVHGKYYRRSHLLETGIRFDESLRFNEDSAFNAILNAITDFHRVGEIKTAFPPYTWNRRMGSTTQRDGVDDPANWGHFLRNLSVCRTYLEKLPKERYEDMIVRTVYDTYYMANNHKISPEMRDQICEKFREFVREEHPYEMIRPDDDTLQQIKEVSRRELMDENHPVGDDYKIVDKWFDEEILVQK